MKIGRTGKARTPSLVGVASERLRLDRERDRRWIVQVVGT
jgi:hypothetical protein